MLISPSIVILVHQLLLSLVTKAKVNIALLSAVDVWYIHRNVFGEHRDAFVLLLHDLFSNFICHAMSVCFAIGVYHKLSVCHAMSVCFAIGVYHKLSVCHAMSV